MNSRVAFPFLTLSNSSVEAFPWMVSLNGGEWIEAEDSLKDWDSSSTIRLQREIRLDSDNSSMDLGIREDELWFSLNVIVGTGMGILPRRIVVREHQANVPLDCPVHLELEVPGYNLSSILDVVVEITLAAPATRKSVLSPNTLGDRLWRERQRFRLEDDENLFPIEVTDFQALRLGDLAEFAPWYLHWSPRDWTRDFHGATRLFLNSQQPDIIQRIESLDVITLQTLLADVMSQICERFLKECEADESTTQFEPGSLGAQAKFWLANAWPGRDWAFVRSILENRPGEFRAAFLTLAELRQD